MLLLALCNGLLGEPSANQPAMQLYSFGDILISYEVPEPIGKMMVHSSTQFQGFDSAGIATICSAHWVKQGLLSQTPVGRFTMAVMRKPEAVG